MFKDSAALDRQRTATGFDKALAHYAEAAETWFDGSANSVDTRLAACTRLLHKARATVGRLSSVTDARPYLHVASALDADRRALVALRDDLLTGASNREDVVGPPGWRTARGHQGAPEPDINDYTDPGWGTQGDYDVAGGPSAGNIYTMPSGPHMGARTPPPGTSAGSNEFKHPAPRTNKPRYLNEVSVTKVKTKALPSLTSSLHHAEGALGQGAGSPLPPAPSPTPSGTQRYPGTEADRDAGKVYPPSDTGGALTGYWPGYSASLHGSDRRWVELESARFVAANTDTLDDNHELATRAQSYAATKTSTFTPARSAAICERFVARVASLGRQAYRPAVVRTAAYQDFDDQAFYLC